MYQISESSVDMTVVRLMVLITYCASKTVDGFEKEKIYCIGNKQCTCKIIKCKIMQCHGNDIMNTLPELSRNITTLIVIHGNFRNVTKETFAPIANSSVTHLRMTICKMETLSADALFYLKGLKEIDFSENINLDVLNVAKSLHSLVNSDVIRTIKFNRMRWKSIPKNMFAGLVNTSIVHIQLGRNYFTSLNSSIFSSLTTLRNLSLGWTGLSNYGSNFSGLSHIRALNLAGTWFNRFPNFCDDYNRTVVPKLTHLYLDESKIDSLSTVIKCLDSLILLNLSGLSLRIIYPNTFSGLKSLQFLNLMNLGSQFRRVTVSAFNSTSLLSLKFSVNEKKFFSDKNNRNFQASQLFAFCRQLHHLDLSQNRLMLSNKIWNKMLSPLQRLISLTLKDTKIKYIPDISRTLPRLLHLDLSHNKISFWGRTDRENPFESFSEMQSVNLRYNIISIINETSFPRKWMDGTGTLRNMFLADNPFSCTCEISWFREWMDTAKEKNITIDADNWKCLITQNLLETYHPDKSFECIMPYVITAIVTIIVILLSAFVCFVLRFRIKLAWHRCKTRKKNYTIMRDINYKYDSFIAYSYRDLWWIQEHAIPQLEENKNLSLCIRDRDFRVGTVFSNAIIRHISASRSVLFLLSDNFAQDVWCKFQLDITNFINICESNMVAVIPVMLQEEISFRYMTEALFQIIKCRDYLQWNQGGSSEELFWNSILERIPRGVNSLEDSFADDSVQKSGIQA